MGRASIALCLLAAAALLAVTGWRLTRRPSSTSSAPARPDAETMRVLARAFPGWPAADLEQLMRESWMRPYAYEPFTQFTEGPPSPGALERYARNRRAATAVAQAFGVRAAFVWRPVPVRGCDLAEHPFADRVRQAPWAQAVRDGYERAAAAHRAGEDGGLLWCADVLAGMEPCDYLDAVHYAPALARRVATCIAEQLDWP